MGITYAGRPPVLNAQMMQTAPIAPSAPPTVAQIEPGKLISFVTHPYEKYSVDLFLYECTLLTEGLEPRAVNAFKWVASQEFDQYPFTPADEASMNKLLGVT